MIAKLNHLKFTSDELTAIEIALNTQVKILNLQASAGGGHALTQLNQTKHALARLTQQKPRERSITPRFKSSWLRRPCIFC